MARSDVKLSVVSDIFPRMLSCSLYCWKLRREDAAETITEVRKHLEADNDGLSAAFLGRLLVFMAVEM